jgi:hypothetical protein
MRYISSLSKGALFLLVSAFIISSFSTPGLLLGGETPGVLDGRSYVGKTGEVGKEAAEDEEISGEGDKIHFEAETESPKHGKIVWKGTVEGDSIDVNYTWTKKGWLGTKTKDKWFKGALKK